MAARAETAAIPRSRPDPLTLLTRSSTQARPSRSRGSQNVPWTFAHTATMAGIAHRRPGWARRLITIHRLIANSGAARSWGRIARSVTDTKNDPMVSHAAGRFEMPAARHAR